MKNLENNESIMLSKLGHLRKWQIEAFDAWKVPQKGIIKVVTGAGKTRFALKCIEHFADSTLAPHVLIVVPSVALLDQWYVALVEDLKLDPGEISVFGGGVRSLGFKRYNISIINTAIKIGPFPKPKNWLAVFDECHRYASSRNRAIFDSNFGATLGLSATPERQYDEGLDEILVPYIGPVFFEYSMAEGLMDGIIHRFTLRNIELELLMKEKKQYETLTARVARLIKKQNSEEESDKLKSLLIKRSRISAESPVRVPIAVSLVDSHRDEQCIVFHESIRFAKTIADLLANRGHSVAEYHSGLGFHMRWDNLIRFRRGQVNVLVCCRALDEGVDVPSASIGIIAASSSSTRQRIQRLGRLLRVHPDKNKAIVYTLYATVAEKRRLEAEEENLETVTEIEWFSADFSREK